MVKLFVGNLADTVDSTKLKQVFQQFTKVTECDVVKNYAFVHIEDDDVQSIISRLNGYTLEGKNIHIQLSTSKLRSQPGMSNQCFRCASTEHKTPNCPKDPNNQITQTIKIDLTGAVKRPAGALDGPDAKRPVQMISMVDEEIPRPPQPELQQLYEEYNLSRQRYSYYRERLQKEIHAKRNGMSTTGSVYVTPLAPTISATSTQLSSSAVPYIAPQQQAYTQPVAVGGNHPYSLKAPYAVATPPQVQTLPSVPQIGTVTGQQASFITSQQPATMYTAVPATVQQGIVGVPQQQPAAVGVQYATQVQQQQSTLGVQSSAPMTTQQYLQTVGLQQSQQQPGTQFTVGQAQQSTLNAPYAGLSASTPWIQQQQQQQQQQQPMQQSLLGQFQRQPPYQQSPQRQPVVAQQQPYQAGGPGEAEHHLFSNTVRFDSFLVKSITPTCKESTPQMIHYASKRTLEKLSISKEDQILNQLLKQYVKRSKTFAEDECKEASFIQELLGLARLGASYRAYRAGPNQFGYLPDPPKSGFVPDGGMRPEDSQRVHLINAFRRYGYLQAELDPLGLHKQKDVPELNPAIYGLSPDEYCQEKN
ncbi:hypothetical protein KIN20_031176 [Parelaphostrongylus tenuis]|uniref:RRM domain-containing protein n=1 Tax=Parelaphostrongylus tenuis TaxID=148309 RepID=A0AAD5WGN6_PARTN|nr:hypothetical protein KIN20_031176 [Parelaphostrongylus tenuis]